MGVGLLLDYTRSIKKEARLEFLNYFLNKEYTSFIILYGNRAYPLCELNCYDLAMRDYSLTSALEGPPEPYRAVKEAVEVVNAYGLRDQKILLVWSASRKPLVDIRLAFNYAEYNSLQLYMVVMHPHSASWLTRILSSIDEEKIIKVTRKLSIDRIIRKIAAY